MKPTERNDLLAAYADGELVPDLVRQTEAQLRDDPAGREHVANHIALRKSLTRTLHASTIPAGLEQRIRAQIAGVRPTQPSVQLLRLSGPGLAIAAALLLAFIFWPASNARSLGIDTAFFAQHHLVSAVSRHLDTLNVRDGVPWERFEPRPDAAQAIAQNASFPVRLPDLGFAGYGLYGAAEHRCTSGTCVLQAYFRCLQSGNYVSLFVVDGCARLGNRNGDPCESCGCAQKQYIATRASALNLLAWEEDGRTFVLCCGVASHDQLMQIANKLREKRIAHDVPADAPRIAQSSAP